MHPHTCHALAPLLAADETGQVCSDGGDSCEVFAVTGGQTCSEVRRARATVGCVER